MTSSREEVPEQLDFSGRSINITASQMAEIQPMLDRIGDLGKRVSKSPGYLKGGSICNALKSDLCPKEGSMAASALDSCGLFDNFQKAKKRVEYQDKAYEDLCAKLEELMGYLFGNGAVDLNYTLKKGRTEFPDDESIPKLHRFSRVSLPNRDNIIIKAGEDLFELGHLLKDASDAAVYFALEHEIIRREGGVTRE